MSGQKTTNDGSAADADLSVDEAKALPASNKKPKIATDGGDNAAEGDADTNITFGGGITVDNQLNESLEITDIDQECFLLSDTTETDIPAHLRRLMSFYNEKTLTQAEAVFLLIYIVALETGYVTQHDYQRLGDQLMPLSGISTYNMNNVYLLAQHKPVYEVDDDRVTFSARLRQHTYVVEPDDPKLEPSPTPVLSTLLTAFVTGDLMLVSICPTTSQPKMTGYSCCLSIGRYVMLTYSKKQPYNQRFRLLDELSQRLRDKIFGPMRCQQLMTLGIMPNPALQCLPTELYEFILKHLEGNQRKIFLNVSKHIYYSSRDSKYLKPSYMK